MDINLTNSTIRWIFTPSDIKLGGSSVLGNNYFIFNLIHGTALILITVSLLSCASVIISIIWKAYKNGVGTNPTTGRRGSRAVSNFADRFPLYLAVADLLWSISHMMDHICLVSTHKYPESTVVSTLLAVNLWMFLGYQQLMHAGLAIYTYVRVVHEKNMNLGAGEWKLHCICVLLMLVSIGIFLPLGSFGPAGYWMLDDVRTPGGLVLGFYIVISGVTQASCTTFGYRGITRVIEKQKQAMSRHSHPNNNTSMDPKHRRKALSTASECLTTFVRVSLCLYWPMAVLVTIFNIECICGILDPYTTLGIVIVANSSGWANAWGYFHNLRVKEKRERKKEMEKELLAPAVNSTSMTGVSSDANSNSGV